MIPLTDQIRFALETASESLRHATYEALTNREAELAGRFAADRTIVQHALDTLNNAKKGAA